MVPPWFPRLLAIVCIAITALIASAPAAAQSAVAGRPLGTCVLRDTGGMDPATLIRDPGRFDCDTPQHRLGQGDFWVVSSDINEASTALRPLNVRMTSLWQHGVTLHVLYADGRIRALTEGADSVTPLIQLGAVIEQQLPRDPANVVRVMWHVRDAANMRGLIVGARLATAAESAQSALILSTGYGLFAGLCIALITYNLALWAALRHRFQLYYCVMVASLVAYTFSSSGAIGWLFPEIHNNERLRLNYVMLGMASAMVIVFARSFFEPRIVAGWVERYTNFYALLILVAGPLVVAVSYIDGAVFYADRVYSGIILGVLTVIGPILWRAWRRRSDYLLMFTVCWGAPIFMALLRVLNNFHIIAWSFLLDNSTILSMSAEALLSALAIAYRIKLLSRERDEAIASEVMARRLADTDPLTGLLNRRAFLRQAIGRAGEQQLIITDLDHFKRVNDTLGHDGGDEVLRIFARLLRRTAPESALVTRLGGEEFAILSDAVDPVEPEKLLAQLRATRMPFDLTVTASAGTAHGPMTSEIEWKALYRTADSALFSAKSAGRDRTRSA